jgi:hypothetical protein
MASKDKRRTDVRVPVNSEPFWFTSSIITTADVNIDAVLADFKALDGTFIILSAGVEIIEAFDGTASLTVGLGTMATPTIGTVTYTDPNRFIISADVTESTVGYYSQVGSQLATDLGVGKAEVIKGADTTVPVVYAVMTATNPTVGKARVHLLLSKVPVM